MHSPRVSVVIPCFNAAATIEITIESLVAQTMGDFEIIAIDNNCTDETPALLTSLATKEPRLRVIEQSIPGASAARNAGIQVALGKFVAFLDADDLWDPTYLERHLQNLADERVDISYSQIRRIDLSGQPTGFCTQPKPRVSAGELLRSNPCTVMVVVRAIVFEHVGVFDETLGAVEDQEFLFRAAAQGHRLKGITEVLASYRITPGGLSADLENMLRSHGELLQAAARIAPDLVAQHQRLANAAMLRYCARRAIEQQEPAVVSWHYLTKMYVAAPDLLLREPAPTAKVSIRVLLTQLASTVRWFAGSSHTPREV